MDVVRAAACVAIGLGLALPARADRLVLVVGGTGGDGGPAADAATAAPCGVAVDPVGNMYVGE
ncbi:MAG: hypothetical protein C0501_27990 [Isosphaera sp.]|nr:hypothetical protein [Isosphaera sp.]